MKVRIAEILRRLRAYCVFFWRQFRALPPALIQRCLRQIFGGFVIAVFSCLMIAVFHSGYFAVGFLFALYMLWPVYTTTKDYFEKKIYKQDMVCTKLAKKISPVTGERTLLYFRTLDKPPQHKMYYLHLSRSQRDQFSEGVIFSLYFHERNPSEILAWDFVGVDEKN